MKTEKTTYIVKGLLEWQFLLRTGGAELPVHFTGGTMGSNGVIGARYVTANPVIKKLIEASPEFRSGKIRILRT